MMKSPELFAWVDKATSVYDEPGGNANNVIGFSYLHASPYSDLQDWNIYRSNSGSAEVELLMWSIA